MTTFILHYKSLIIFFICSTHRSIPQWGGSCSKDGRYGIYAPSRGGLDILDLRHGTVMRTLVTIESLLPFQYQWYVRFILKPDQKRFYWVIFESSNCDHCWTLSELPFPMSDSSCKKSTVAGKLVFVVAVKRSCHLFIRNRSQKSLRASSTSSASSTRPTSTSYTTTAAEKRWGSSGCLTGSWLLTTG